MGSSLPHVVSGLFSLLIFATCTVAVHGQSAASDPDAVLARLTEQGKQAASQHDYPQLLALRGQRHQVLQTGKAGATAMFNLMKEDERLIHAARTLVAAGRYRDAVSQLEQRWLARRSDAIVNGELAEELVKSSLSAIVMDDAWVLPRERMAQILDEAIKRDPLAVEASVLQAWLIAPDPAEELTRLDIRPTVLARNRLLLPIRDSMLQLAPTYRGLFSSENAGGKEFRKVQEAIDYDLANTPLVDPELFRRTASALEYCLGASRNTVVSEFKEWWTNLSSPKLSLLDRTGSRYEVAGGLLWKQEIGPDGLTWYVMVQQESKPNAPLQYKRYRVRPVRWVLENPSDPAKSTDFADLGLRLQRSKPVLGGFRVFSGRSLAVYSSNLISPEEIEDRNLPQLIMSQTTFQNAWNVQQKLESKDEQGKSLCFPRGLANGDDIDGLDLVSSDETFWGKYSVKSVMIWLEEAPGTATGAAFDEKTSAPYFLDSQGRRILVRRDGMLEYAKPGAGSILIPLMNDCNPDPKYRRACEIILKSARLAGWNELKGVFDRDGQVGAITADDLAVTAVLDDQIRLRKAAGETDKDYSNKVADCRMKAKEVRQKLNQTPQGYEPAPRSRLVLPNSNQKAFEFFNADAVSQSSFHAEDEVREILKALAGDFLVPAFATVPWRGMLATPDQDSPLDWADSKPFPSQFYQVLANECFTKTGDLHRAAAFLRDHRDWGLELPRDLDSRHPLDKTQFGDLLLNMGWAAQTGPQAIRSLALQAANLRKAGRVACADELLRAGVTEWRVCALPLMRELERYSVGYAYSPPGSFKDNIAAIERELNSLIISSRNHLKTSGKAGFDEDAFSKLRRSPLLEVEVEKFYASNPSLAEWCRCKRWIVKNAPRFRSRIARSDFSRMLLFWRPVKLNGKSMIPLSDDEILDDAHPGNGLADAWREVWFLSECGDVTNARACLLELAGTLAPTQESTGSLEGAVRSVNRVGALLAARMADFELPEGMQAASLDRFVGAMGEAGGEFTGFVVPALEAAAVDSESINTASKQIEELAKMISRKDSQDPYWAQRYYWYEYTDVLTAFRGYMAQNGDGQLPVQVVDRPLLPPSEDRQGDSNTYPYPPGPPSDRPQVPSGPRPMPPSAPRGMPGGMPGMPGGGRGGEGGF